MQQYEPDTFSCGKARFKLTANIYSIQSQQTTEILNDDKWQLSFGYDQQKNWKALFQQMTSCQIQNIDLSANEHSQIIKQIQYVDYKMLKQLQLSKNKIENIEALSLIDLPSLKVLLLDNNRINRMTCMNKLSTSIERLWLKENPITQIGSLTRSLLNPALLELLFLQDSISDIDIGYEICRDLSLIAKLNSNLIETVCKYYPAKEYNKIKPLKCQNYDLNPFN